MRHTALLLTAVSLLPQIHAQENKTATYQIEFTIRDDSDTSKVQHYSLQVDASRKATFHAGTREDGVNIECTARESNGLIALEGTVELVTVTSVEGISEPVTRQRVFSFSSTDPLGTSVTIFDPRKPRLAFAGPYAPPPLKQLIEATVTKK